MSSGPEDQVGCEESKTLSDQILNFIYEFSVTSL
jgi:hypothetical protein